MWNKVAFVLLSCLYSSAVTPDGGKRNYNHHLLMSGGGGPGLPATSGNPMPNLMSDLDKCCQMGSDWAGERLDGCDGFPVPVAGVPMQMQVEN